MVSVVRVDKWGEEVPHKNYSEKFIKITYYLYLTYRGAHRSLTGRESTFSHTCRKEGPYFD
ncbi:MAG: hypothetical protein QXR19_14650 [Candidatus Jordarchaeaceae archaeon]